MICRMTIGHYVFDWTLYRPRYALLFRSLMHCVVVEMTGGSGNICHPSWVGPRWCAMCMLVNEGSSCVRVISSSTNYSANVFRIFLSASYSEFCDTGRRLGLTSSSGAAGTRRHTNAQTYTHRQTDRHGPTGRRRSFTCDPYRRLRTSGRHSAGLVEKVYHADVVYSPVGCVKWAT